MAKKAEVSNLIPNEGKVVGMTQFDGFSHVVIRTVVGLVAGYSNSDAEVGDNVYFELVTRKAGDGYLDKNGEPQSCKKDGIYFNHLTVIEG